jgi:hypothetical protein
MGRSVSWRAIAGSVVGTSHSRRGAPGQDYSVLDISGDDGGTLIAIAADGAGSAEHGQQGAEIACRHMHQCVQWWLRSYDDMLHRIDATVVSKWIEWTRRELQVEATKLGSSTRSLACTVLGVVANHSRVACFQIGDGALVLRTVRQPMQVVFWPKSGEYANMTHFLTDAVAQQNLHVTVIEDEPIDVAVFTDGLQRLALQFSTQSVHVPFFTPMFERLAAEPAGHPLPLQQHLLNFLNSAAVNERTDDDKTLILATRRAMPEIHNLPIDS